MYRYTLYDKHELDTQEPVPWLKNQSITRTLEAPCVPLGVTTVPNFRLITPLLFFKTTYMYP